MVQRSAEGQLGGLYPLGDSASLNARVEEALQTAILTGELAPGTRLSVPQIAQLLGVSRTPAREALFALEREGLVQIEPRRGAMVLQGGLQDLIELFEVRESLESLAARLAAKRATPDERRSLMELFERYVDAEERKAVDDYAPLDFEFHSRIGELARNRRLVQALARIEQQAQVVGRAMSVHGPSDMSSVLDDHRAITHAIVKGEPRRAETAARKHVRHVLESAREILFNLNRATEGDEALGLKAKKRS